MNRRGNGLSADTYAPLVDLAPHLADAILTALRDAGVAAYAASAASAGSAASPGGELGDDVLDRLYVDVDMKPTAESVLQAHLTRLRDAGARGADGGRTEGRRSSDQAEPDSAFLAGEERRRTPGGAGGTADDPQAANSMAGGPTGEADGPQTAGDADEEPQATDGTAGDSEEQPSGGQAAGAPAAASGPPDAGRGDSAAGTAERDEDAIWAEIVAGFDAEPDGDGTPWPEQEDIREDRPEPPAEPEAGDDSTGRLPRARVVKAADSPEMPTEDDEGHFVPPPPPPLPSPDPLTKGAWAALIGGPLYLLITVVLGWEVPGWAAFLAVAAFIGGFVTLVLRMGDEPRDPDDGAVV